MKLCTVVKRQGADRDSRQMEGFRECLSRYGLFDLGSVGQHFTWCNGRLGNQWTKLRLDRMVAIEAWMRKFPKACVHHFSLSISNHCLLALTLKQSQPRSQPKKRFFFEVMWTREDGCREVVESVWDPLRGDSEFRIMDRLRNFQEELKRWIWKVFGNINKVLKQKQGKLQLLETTECAHENAEEIRKVIQEINETLTREEIMWNQRSRALWIKRGGGETKIQSSFMLLQVKDVEEIELWVYRIWRGCGKRTKAGLKV